MIIETELLATYKMAVSNMALKKPSPSGFSKLTQIIFSVVF